VGNFAEDVLRGNVRVRMLFQQLTGPAGREPAERPVIPRPCPSCVSPERQLKREWSPVPSFGGANGSSLDISNTSLAHGFLKFESSHPSHAVRSPRRLHPVGALLGLRELAMQAGRHQCNQNLEKDSLRVQIMNQSALLIRCERDTSFSREAADAGWRSLLCGIPR
jgi:hypothetical protein